MKNSEDKKTAVPKLRFPEFINETAWVYDNIEDIFKITRGYVLPMGLVRENSDENIPYPVYSSQTKNKGLAGYYKDYLYEDAITWTTDGANAGDVNYRKGKFYCTNVCGVLLNKEGYANKCTAELIGSVTKSHVSYVGNPKLMNGVMGKINIPFPLPNEQQKIADCLSSVDELIEAEVSTLDLYKEHKKGLLQKLFPQNGKTTPEYRFPEFENSGEWNEVMLGDISDVTKLAGYEYTKHVKYEDAGKIIAVRGLNCKNGKLDLSQVKYIDNSELSMLTRSKLFISDILFTYVGTVGEVAMIEENDRFYLAPNVSRIRINKGLSPNFIKQLLASETFYKNIVLKHIATSSQPALSMANIRRFVLIIPNLEIEQQKIADCFTSIDELIEQQTKKIDALKEHKKGLMQQLFPKLQ